jgi:hypothetical protein
MRYSDFRDPNCPCCGNFFDQYTESVLLTAHIERSEDEDEFEVTSSNICWETSEMVVDGGLVALECSRCGTLWHSKIKG